MNNIIDGARALKILFISCTCVFLPSKLTVECSAQIRQSAGHLPRSYLVGWFYRRVWEPDYW